jgi:pseudouridine kinase
MTEAGPGEGPVLVIGASGMDIVGRADERLRAGASNPGHLRLSHGGVARNLAENLQRLGAHVHLITAVGDDAEGHQLLDHAAGLGIDVEHSLTVPGQTTGAYLAVLDHDGILQVGLDDMSATAALTPAHFRTCEPLFDMAATVVVDGNLAPKSLAAVVALCQRHGVPLAADPTSVSLAPKFEPHLAALTLLSPNLAEAAMLCGNGLPESGEERSLEAARQLVSRGVHMAIVSRAEFGVSYASPAGSGNVPAIKTEVLDPTGAGDALLGTVVFGLLNEIPLDEAVRLGVTAAALTLRSHGTVAPDLSLERLYEELI